jgi:hypothetical protein
MDVLVRNSSMTFLDVTSEIFLFRDEAGLGESELSGVMALLKIVQILQRSRK